MRGLWGLMALLAAASAAAQGLPRARAEAASLAPATGAPAAPPSSQPARRVALVQPAPATAAPALDLEVRRPVVDERPRFHAFKPFIELVSYQTFLVASGWLYGHSPLDWDPPTWKKWTYNLTHAPVWRDGDPWLLNWGGHAVFGSDHYMMARNCGWSWYSSVAFNAFGSFVWEYVTEGIFEQPSAIDLVVTPVLGSLLGEVRYRLRLLIKKHAGDRWYGLIAMGILDPTHTFFELWGWR